jgi:catechol 2,3-dioxygenase-like lactoylglutathione lyase family enzyme
LLGEKLVSSDREDVEDWPRRHVLRGAAAFALAFGARPLGAQAPDAALVARQLPLQAVGLEHIGTVVPDVTAAATFFARVFNAEVYKEQAPPLRYYVTLDPGYIAFGSREGERGAFIDHDCVLVEQYDRAAMAERLAQESLPPGRFGIIADPDGLGLQLLAAGGLAASTEHAGRLSDAAPLVRPRGLRRVVRYVSDLETARAFYRKFLGAEVEAEVDGAPEAVWFQAGHTLLGVERVPAGEAPRIDRFCVNVAAGGFDADDVAAALETLGAEVVSAAPTRLHFRSPEGIGVELEPVDPAAIWGRM